MESWNSTLFQSSVDKLSAEISALTESAGLGDSFQAAIARSLHRLAEAIDRLIEAWEFEVGEEL